MEFVFLLKGMAIAGGWIAFIVAVYFMMRHFVFGGNKKLDKEEKITWDERDYDERK